MQLCNLAFPFVLYCVEASADHSVYLTTATGFNYLYVQWSGKSKGSKAQSLRHYRSSFAPGGDKSKPLPTILQLLTDEAKKS